MTTARADCGQNHLRNIEEFNSVVYEEISALFK